MGFSPGLIVKLPVFLVLLLIVGVVTKCSSSGDKKTVSDKCPTQTTTDGSDISVSQCVLEDKRTFAERINAVSKSIIGEFNRNQRLREAARDESYVQAKGRMDGNRAASGILDGELGKDPSVDRRIRTETLISEFRAEDERKDLELKRKIREEETAYTVASDAFKAVILGDRHFEARFAIALNHLRKDINRVGGLVEVADTDRSSLEERKTAVVNLLKGILEALGDPRFKPLRDAVARQRGFTAQDLREAISKDWHKFVADRCGRTPPPQCWVQFVKATNDETSPFSAGFHQIETAYRNYRFHDAISLTEALVDYVVARPHLETPAARVRRAARRVPTFCAEVAKQGYLAVWQSQLSANGIGSSLGGPETCIWAWKASRSDGWSLFCSTRGSTWGFNQPSGGFVSAADAAPSGQQLPNQITAAHPYFTQKSLTENCGRSLAELTNDDADIPGIDRVVNPKR